LCLALLLLLNLEEEGAVDVRQNATEGNRSANQGVKLLVAANGELKVPGSDTLDLEILGGILSQSMSAED
jgi:hypothetical protein